MNHLIKIIILGFICGIIGCSKQETTESVQQTQNNGENSVIPKDRRLSYLEALTILSQATNASQMNEDLDKLELLEKLTQDPNQIHARLMWATNLQWNAQTNLDGDISGYQMEYQLAEQGHPYAALEIAGQLMSKEGRNAWKGYTGLDEKTLKRKIEPYTRLALKYNIRDAKDTYLYFFSLDNNDYESSIKNIKTSRTSEQYILAKSFAEEIALNVGNALSKNIADITYISRYIELLAYDEGDQWNADNACAWLKYFKENLPEYNKESHDENLKWAKQAIPTLEKRLVQSHINQDKCDDIYLGIKNHPRVSFDNWSADIDIP